MDCKYHWGSLLTWLIRIKQILSIEICNITPINFFSSFHVMLIIATIEQNNFRHHKRSGDKHLEEYATSEFQNERFTHTLPKICGACGICGE